MASSALTTAAVAAATSAAATSEGVNWTALWANASEDADICSFYNDIIILTFADADLLLVIGQGVAMLCCVVIGSSYIALPTLRTQPNSLFALKSVADFFFAICVALPAFHALLYEEEPTKSINSSATESDIVEAGADEERTFRTASCLCQESLAIGAVTQFCIIASELTLLAVAVDLVVNLKSPFTKFTTNNHIYRAVIATVAVLSVIVYCTVPTDMTGEWIFGFCLYVEIPPRAPRCCFNRVVVVGVVLVWWECGLMLHDVIRCSSRGCR